MNSEQRQPMFHGLTHIITDQPFIVTTGIAALIHSTWSLGTMFAGAEPSAELDFLLWLRWVIPAFLIAFSFDVGQISVSMGIRSGQRSRARFVTFAVLAAATYYCQWLFLAHHVPLLELSAGVRDEWRPFVAFMRDLGIWIIPGLLPISTTLYTFGSSSRYTFRRPVTAPPRVTVTERKIEVRDTEQPVTPPLLQSTGTPDEPPAQGGIVAVEAWFADHPEALEQLAAGALSYRRVGEAIGVSHTTVRRFVKSLDA